MVFKRKKMQKLMECECADKIEICTPNFCATGCLDENAELDDVVVLNNAEVIYNDEKGTRKHKKKMCICDEYIISFQSADCE